MSRKTEESSEKVRSALLITYLPAAGGDSKKGLHRFWRQERDTAMITRYLREKRNEGVPNDT
jgi:hypothetical protein